MHRKKEYVVECADPNCKARVRTTSHKREKLCPECKRARRAGYQERLREQNKEAPDQFDPDAWLDKKLDRAQYCIQYDAAPPCEAFPKDARITTQELILLLQFGHIAPGSLIRRCRDQTLHKVIYSKETGKFSIKQVTS